MLGEKCVRCGGETNFTAAFAHEGGLICFRCANKEEDV